MWDMLGPQAGGDGCKDGRMDGHTDVQIPPVFYRTLSPSGPQPKKEGTKKEGRKRETNARKEERKE